MLCVCVHVCIYLYILPTSELISLTVEEEETLQLSQKEFAIQVGMRLQSVLVLFHFFVIYLFYLFIY